ncbi:hypothetical protein VL73_28 [Erwinia phage VL73]
MTTKMTPRPSASDIAYIERGIYEYLMDILEPSTTDYTSDHSEFIRNEVLKDIKRKVSWAIQPK